MKTLDILSEMAFYCSIRFYYCMGSPYFSKFLTSQLLARFISLGLYFFVLRGVASFLKVFCWYKTIES